MAIIGFYIKQLLYVCNMFTLLTKIGEFKLATKIFTVPSHTAVVMECMPKGRWDEPIINLQLLMSILGCMQLCSFHVCNMFTLLTKIGEFKVQEL